MTWRHDDSAFFYAICSFVFVLGFLSTILGIPGFVLAVVGAYVVIRFLGDWLRSRFGIGTDVPRDRLDDAVDAGTFGQGLRTFLRGKPRS